MYLDINTRDNAAASLSQLSAEPAYRTASDLIAQQQPHDPILCFSADNLHDQIERFQRSFPGSVTYAVKANHSNRVINEFGRNGVETFDVASIQEMQLVRALIPNAKFHYHNPVKSRREIALAYEIYGVRQFAVDDEVELAKIKDICTPEETTLAIRFRLDGTSAVHDFSTKFGATPAKATELLKAANAAGFTCALTFHPGSQCYDPHAYARHIKAAAQIAKKANVDLASLNVGGGFPAAYEGDRLPPLKDYFSVIEAAASKHFSGNPPLLECEPGRAIVASCMSLLVPVKHVRAEEREVFLQDGIYGTLMEFSQTSLRPAVTWHRQGESAPTDKGEGFKIYGPTCDPMDRLPGQYRLPSDIQEGDYLEFASMGAYSIATATRFNGYGDVQIVPVTDVFKG